MAIGFDKLPPVSSPDNATHVNCRVFLVELVKVTRPGLTGSIPAYVII